MYQESSGEFPKVSAVVSSEPVNTSQSLAMLIEFLTAEQHKPESSNHWEDIFLVSETLAHTNKEKAKLRDLRGLATLKSFEAVAPTDDFKQDEDRAVKGEPSSPQDKKLSIEKEELKTLEKAERKAAKAAEKDEKKKRKEAKKERKENKKQKR
jgi:hypothetical protein